MHSQGFGAGFFFGHGLFGILFWLILILVVVALVKYLFFDERKGE